MSADLRDPALSVVHAFAAAPVGLPSPLARPRQVHGARVVTDAECLAGAPAPEADAVLAQGHAAAVVTADCVPVLLAAPGGRVVAAVHAGWRGLAAGVLPAAVAALTRASGVPAAALEAAIGPHIGACCYEVDAPVLEALAVLHRDALHDALRPSRPGHAQLDLGRLAAAALRAAGLDPAHIGVATVRCTFCHPSGLASYRRDGPRAGRLVHYVQPQRGLDTAGASP